jgi:hypothetical protein
MILSRNAAKPFPVAQARALARAIYTTPACIALANARACATLFDATRIITFLSSEIGKIYLVFF